METIKQWLEKSGRIYHLEKTRSLARPCYRIFFDQRYQEEAEKELMPMVAGQHFDILYTFTSADNVLRFKDLLDGFDRSMAAKARAL